MDKENQVDPFPAYCDTFPRKQFVAAAKEYHDGQVRPDFYETYIGLASFLEWAISNKLVVQPNLDERTAVEAFTVRKCAGWCVEVTFPSTPAGAVATHTVVNAGVDEGLARQIAKDCNAAVAAGRLGTERFNYLQDRERDALAEMVRAKDMSPEAVMRHALRIHQFVDHHLLQGMEMCFRKPDGEIVRPFYHSKLEPFPTQNKE